MAYGNQGNSGGNIDRLINAKYTSKEGTTFLEVPIFKLSEKQGDKYPDLTKEQLLELTGKDVHPVEVSGNLVEITVREGEYEGSPVRSFKAVLDDVIKINGEDKKVRTYVDFGLGSFNGRTAANLVLNLKAFDNVKFSSWASRDKDTGKSYSKISLRQGDSTETIKWKYDPKAENSPLPAPREFAGKGGKTERDYTAQEVFLYQELEKFAEVVKAAAKNTPKANTPKQETAAPENQASAGDEPPF